MKDQVLTEFEERCYKLKILELIKSVRRGSHWGGSPQNGLGVEQTCETTLALAYVLRCLFAVWLQLQMIGRSPRWEQVLIWCVAIEHQRLSSIRIIFIDYQTSKLQCNY